MGGGTPGPWRFFKPAVAVVCVLPGVTLGHQLWRFFVGGDLTALGVDPNVTVMHATGKDALGFLIAALAVTPVRRIFRLNRVQAVRRLLGVTAFFYALAHLTAYLVFDQLCYSAATCDFGGIWVDVLSRKFIFSGMLAFSVLAVLAATSTTAWVRRLGRNWTRLHRLAYLAAAAGAIHFVWGQKSDIREPLQWTAMIAALLGIRVYFALKMRRGAAARVAKTTHAGT